MTDERIRRLAMAIDFRREQGGFTYTLWANETEEMLREILRLREVNRKLRRCGSSRRTRHR